MRRAAEGFRKRINAEFAENSEFTEKKIRKYNEREWKKGRPVDRPLSLSGMLRLSAAVAVIAAVAAEVEEVEEIAERRAVERYVGIVFVDYGVGEIIAAATG
jgi:hypothetical protein